MKRYAGLVIAISGLILLSFCSFKNSSKIVDSPVSKADDQSTISRSSLTSDSSVGSETLPGPSSNSSGKNNTSASDIQIQSPMTLSSNDMYPVTGQHQYLRLEMTKGTYSEDWEPGPLMGTIWSGDFRIELKDESNNTIAKTDISSFDAEPLQFNKAFDIQFDDYNNDGDPDFTLGQYGSSNGNNYKIYTIRKDGKIEKLPVKDYPVLFISQSTGSFSTKLTKVDSVTFKKEYYDNSAGQSYADTFRWDGTEFAKISSKGVSGN